LKLPSLTPGAYFDRVHPIDLVHFGLIPEFIGRFPVITSTSELTHSELISILHTPTNAIMKQFSYHFALYGIEMICTEKGDQHIAEIAFERKTGARGLRSIVEHILTAVMFIIPSEMNETPNFPTSPHHPLYHTIVIDEKSARAERGVVMLTHDITLAEYNELVEKERQSGEILVDSDSRIRFASIENLPHGADTCIAF
jgi:hypothetical protein